jgi:type VI secretion system secreted protein Hcp
MAIDMFLQVDGVKGESADANHQGWIDINSYSWGAAQSAVVSGSGLGAGKVSYHDLQIDTNVDSGTPAMLKLCSSGKHIANVKVSICKAGGTPMEYTTILLKDALITGVHFNGANGGEQSVSYSFQGSKIENHYWVQQKDGSKGAESQMGWDITGNVATA